MLAQHQSGAQRPVFAGISTHYMYDIGLAGVDFSENLCSYGTPQKISRVLYPKMMFCTKNNYKDIMINEPNAN